MIRKFQKEDLPQILNLCREVRQYHIDILNGYFTEQDDHLEQLSFMETLKNDKIIALVAEVDDKIIGYLLGEFKEAPYLINSKFAHIANFGVNKNYQKHGIGKKLMDCFVELCKENKIEEIRLGVFNKNINACKFYESYGFTPLEQKMSLFLNKK